MSSSIGRNKIVSLQDSRRRAYPLLSELCYIHNLNIHPSWTEFFPNGSLSSPDTGCIINEKHYHRVLDMLTRTKGRVVVGGQVDPSRKKIDVTVVRDIRPDDSLLEDEIFGPILAVVPVDVSFPFLSK
jgi:Aldehyde dehydrogenase family